MASIRDCNILCTAVGSRGRIKTIPIFPRHNTKQKTQHNTHRQMDMEYMNKNNKKKWRRRSSRRPRRSVYAVFVCIYIHRRSWEQLRDWNEGMKKMKMKENMFILKARGMENVGSQGDPPLSISPLSYRKF